jgi:SagB-type dehydrogenase family enzyme
MARIDLHSPVPRVDASDLPRQTLKSTHKKYLQIPKSNPNADLFQVIERRVTERVFRPLHDGDLESLLWFCAKKKGERRSEKNLRIEHRNCPSGGGIHPVELLTVEELELKRYDAVSHSLSNIEGVPPEGVQQFRQSIRHVLDFQEGTVIWMAGDFERVASRYRSPESIVWRDAGVLLGFFTIVAEGLGLRFCPIGITGEPMLSELLNGVGLRWLGVGGFIVGR